MSHYRRLRVRGGTYFFTVNLAERGSTLLVEHIGSLRSAFQQVKARRPFRVEAIVILPDHLHCLWTLPPDDTDFATRWAGIKSLFSADIPCRPRLTSLQEKRRERGIWQRRYWEHVIRGQEDLLAHACYIHNNPLKHGLVTRVEDWPYSSWHRLPGVTGSFEP